LRLTTSTVNLLSDFLEFAGNVSGVTIQDGTVAIGDLSRMIHDDDLGGEVLGSLGRVILGVTRHVSSPQVLDGDVLDVEANIVSWSSLRKRFVMHFNGLDFSGQVDRGKGDDHPGLNDSSFHTTNGYSSDTTDLVNVLKWKTEGLVGWSKNRRKKLENEANDPIPVIKS